MSASVNNVLFFLQCLIAGETRAIVAPPGDMSSAYMFSSIKTPHEDLPRNEPTSHDEASATRPGQTEPNYHHSDMQALLDADLSDDDADTPCFRGNNIANRPLTGNGLDHVVFSFQRQFLLSNPRQQNWPWNTAVGGPTAETDSAPGLHTMFHESSSGRRHLSSGSAKTVSMPHKDEGCVNALAPQENLKFDKTPLRDSVRDSKADSDVFEAFSTEELFGVASVFDITDDEASEVAKNPCSAKTTRLVDETTSPRSKVPVPQSISCEDDKAHEDSDVDYGDDIRAMFGDSHVGDAECDSMSRLEAGVSHSTNSGELKSVYSNICELMNGTRSISPLTFSEVFSDFNGTEAIAECDYDVISDHDSTDVPNAAETFHEHLRHEWNSVCMTDSSVDSDSDSDTDDLDNTLDTTDTYLTDSSESLELSTHTSNASEESVSLDSTDLENPFAGSDDSPPALFSRGTDNDSISVSDVSLTDRNSLISLQSAATSNSDSLLNENTRVLFLMTDDDRRPPVRWSPRYQSPMGSVNSDSLINGQNRDLFMSGNWDDQMVGNSQHSQNDTPPSDSPADDWYVYDDRLTAELNSLRHLVDMRNYLRSQQRGIVRPPTYEECTVVPPVENEAGVSQPEETVPETSPDPPPPYTEHTHTESPPPDYEQLSDHSVTVETPPGSLARLFQPNSTGSNRTQQDQLNNDLEDHPAEHQTNDAVIDEPTNSSAMLDLGNEAQCQSSGHDSMSSVRSNPPSYHHPVFSLGHHLPLRWNTTAGVNQWASSHMWASFRTPS